MVAILHFPSCPAGQLDRDVASEPVSARIIPFPKSQDSLSRRDVDGLLALIASSGGGDWVCETERDGASNLSAFIARGVPERHGYTALLVCRKDGKLNLIDARLAARWGTLGVFSDIADLARAVGKIISR